MPAPGLWRLGACADPAVVDLALDIDPHDFSVPWFREDLARAAGLPSPGCVDVLDVRRGSTLVRAKVRGHGCEDYLQDNSMIPDIL